MPHIISSRDEDVELFFRANGIYNDGMIQLTYGKDILYTKRYNHIVPGKMERIRIKKDILRQLDMEGNIRISWRQREDELSDEAHMYSLSTGM